MRIFIMTMGTRGDLELFLTLGRALQARGHQVLLGAPPLFRTRVDAAALGFTPLGTGTHEEHLAVLRGLTGFADPLQRVREYARRWLLPQLEMSWNEIQYLANRAEYFINNLKILIKRPDGSAVPGAWVNYDPPFSEENRKRYDATQPDDGTILNLVAMNRRLVDPQEQWGERYHFTGFWRAEATSGDGPLPELADFLGAGPPPVVLTMGSMVMFDPARLADTFTEALRRSGQRGVIVGGWAGIAQQAAAPVPEEPRPATMMVGGWTGLATAAPPPAAPPAAPGTLALDAVMSGMSGMSGWPAAGAFPVSLATPLPAPPARAAGKAAPRPAAAVSRDGHIVRVAEAPYDWLFPQAACVIHHGGCGTLSAVMRAGIPSILLPQIPPQELFGRLLAPVHLSTGSFDVNALDPAALADAIRRAVTDETVRSACRDWQAVVGCDPGVGLAVELIEGHAQAVRDKAPQGPRQFRRRRDPGGW